MAWRGVTIALAATLIGACVQALVALPILVRSPPAFGPVLAAKVLYGALLGGAISALAVRMALGDPTRSARKP